MPWRGNCQRVCSHISFVAAPGGDIGRSIGAADTNHALFSSHSGIVACHAEVIGVINGNKAATALPCLFHTPFHRLHTGDHSHGVAGIPLYGGRIFLLDLVAPPWIDHTFFQAL